jgi:hypothetical protein
MTVITYEELVQWRDICEWMAAHGGYAQAETLMRALGKEIEPLVSYDLTHRQKLWDAYKIQMIIWEREDRRYGCWKLKANWELKIDFLEQIVLLGKDPETIPKLYLEVLPKHQAERERKAHAKRQKECLKEIKQSLRLIYHDLNDLEIYTNATFSPEFYQHYIERFRFRLGKARSLLNEWREKFDEGPKPEPGSAVLGVLERQPQPTDAVLGGFRNNAP